MKKFLLAFSILFATFSALHADIIYPDGTKPTGEPKALKKLTRGLANIVFSPFEWPKASFDANLKYGSTDVRQITHIFTVGPYKMLQRASNGISDFCSFLDEDKVPKNYQHISPETISPLDGIPLYSQQFKWETIDTPATRTR